MRKGILITIVLILVGGGAWYFYTKSKVATTGEQPAILKSFFPVGTTVPNITPDGNLAPSSNNPISIPQQQAALFKQLSPSAIAGYSAFTNTYVVTTPATTTKGKPTKQTFVDNIIRYVSRTSGYVYEIKNGSTPTQISNIYIPNTYEALFSDAGKTAIVRFLREDAKTIASYSVPIPDPNPDDTRTQKDGIYLPDNIATLTIPSYDTTTIIRATKETGTTVFSSTTTKNAARKELFRTPFHEWILLTGGKDIYLQTKASGTSEGFLYRLDQSKKRLVRILGNTLGLTTSISPTGTYVLYSTSTKSGVATKILSTKTGVSRVVGTNILPEKCVWLKNEDLICAGGGSVPEGVYPDDWYSGILHFNDQLIHIYTASNTFDILSTPTENYSFDMTNLQVDESTNTLYFIDKPTGLLWQFTL